MNNENKYREQPVAPIVRLCYFGPNLDKCHDQAWLHNKVSDTVVACCQFDRAGMANDLFNHRFGLRARFIGNYADQFKCSWNDHECWFFGNKLGLLRVRAGKSAHYDENSNDIFGVGGFHACTSTRISGNDCDIFLGDNQSNWVTDKKPDESGCTIRNRPAGQNRLGSLVARTMPLSQPETAFRSAIIKGPSKMLLPARRDSSG